MFVFVYILINMVIFLIFKRYCFMLVKYIVEIIYYYVIYFNLNNYYKKVILYV